MEGIRNISIKNINIILTALIPHMTVVFPNFINAEPSAVESESEMKTSRLIFKNYIG